MVFWPDYLELFRRYHGARHIGRYVEQYLYEWMSKAGLSIDEASGRYREPPRRAAGRNWRRPSGPNLLAAGLGRAGPRSLLLADEAWHRGDAPTAKRLRAAGDEVRRRALLRPRSHRHLLKAASGPAAPAVRRLWEWGVVAYRSRRYQARYRDAQRKRRRVPLERRNLRHHPDVPPAPISSVSAWTRWTGRAFRPLEMIVVDQSPDSRTRDIVEGRPARPGAGPLLSQ